MKKSYLRGIIGAVIGGLVGAIPWVALAILNDTMYALLTALIGMGAAKGYEMANGKMGKYTPWIIGAVCLLIITIINFIAMPIFLLIEESLPVTMANFSLLYQTALKEMIIDYVVALVFTIACTSGMIMQIFKTINANKDNEDNVKFQYFNNGIETSEVKKYFLDKDATSEQKAIELNGTEDLNDSQIDALLRNKTLVITSDNKYYYDTAREDKLKKRNKISIIVTCILLVALLLIGFWVANKNMDDNTVNNTTTSPIKGFTYDKPKGYVEYEEDGVYYYYPKKDLSGGSGALSISVVDNITYYEGAIEDLEEAFLGNENYTVKDSKELKVNNYNTVYLLIDDVTSGDVETHIIYYIFLDNKVAYVEARYFNEKNKDEIEKETQKMIESIKGEKTTV